MSRPAPKPWIEKLRGASLVFMVDRAGCIHELTFTAYSQLTGDQLRGSIVVLTRREAEKHASKRRPS